MTGMFFGFSDIIPPGVSIILLASLGTYLVLSPYKVLLWNRSESILLTLALVSLAAKNERLAGWLGRKRSIWSHVTCWSFLKGRMRMFFFFFCVGKFLGVPHGGDCCLICLPFFDS